MTSHLQFFEAVQSDDLSSLYPPSESYADFMERMPKSRQPVPQNIFDRWELYEWRCSNRECEGNKAAPIVAQYGAKCGVCKVRMASSPKGVGERRAYLGWLTGIMEKEESNFFWMTVVANHPDALVMLAVTPVLRQALSEIARLRRDITALAVARTNEVK